MFIGVLKMQVIEKMVPVGKLYDAGSGVRLADTSDTLMANLSNAEKERYGKAIIKVDRQETLNRKDLTLFDKIDALTFEHHGMCLKDSLVTKARIKACKKYGVQFIDRDGLIDHMDCMLDAQQSNNRMATNSNAENMAILLLSKLGEDRFYGFAQAFSSIKNNVALTKADIEALKEADQVLVTYLKSSMIHGLVREAITEACDELGIEFDDLKTKTIH